MNPVTLQIISTIVTALAIAAILGLARMVSGKADKLDVEKQINEVKAVLAKLEVKQDAALLVVGAAITRPELAERILAMTGRADDQKLRMQADIVQLFTKADQNAKSVAEIDKKLDDIPARLRTVEDNQKRN